MLNLPLNTTTWCVCGRSFARILEVNSKSILEGDTDGKILNTGKIKSNVENIRSRCDYMYGKSTPWKGTDFLVSLISNLKFTISICYNVRENFID